MITKRNLLKTTIFAGFYFIYCISAFAAGDVSSCKLGDEIIMKRVTYVSTTSGSSNDLRATCVGNNCAVDLKGWLYYAAGSKISDAPVLIYNHGHDQLRGEPCEIAKFFVKEKFVVFAPLRRGHSAKEPDEKPNGWKAITSTGVFTDVYLENCLEKGSCTCSSCSIGGPLGLCSRNALDVDYIRQQVIDVRDAIAYVKKHEAIGTTGKLADPNRIALLGHSYGGSLVIFANKELKEQNVAIAVSAAELSWGDENPAWESELACAMRDQQRPIYFLQPKNGRSLAPTKTLFEVALEKEYRSQAAIFPKAPCKAYKDGKETYPPCDEKEEKEYRQAHSTFIGRRSQVELWGPTVVDFIKRHPR